MQNTINSHDQTINTKRKTLSLSKEVLKPLQRAFGRQINKSGTKKEISEQFNANEMKLKKTENRWKNYKRNAVKYQKVKARNVMCKRCKDKCKRNLCSIHYPRGPYRFCSRLFIHVQTITIIPRYLLTMFSHNMVSKTSSWQPPRNCLPYLS